MKYFISYSVVRSYGDTPEFENTIDYFDHIEEKDDILNIQERIMNENKFYDVKIINYKDI